MKKIFYIGLALVIAIGILYSQTTKPTTEVFRVGKVKLIRWVWRAPWDSCLTNEAYSGKLARIVIVPGAGNAIPSNNYDLQIKDNFGIDLLASKGLNVDSSRTVYIEGDSLGVTALSKLQFNVQNGGARGDSGVIYLWIQP